MTRNVRDRQISQSHVCRNAHHVIGKLTRQFDGDLTVMARSSSQSNWLILSVEPSILTRFWLRIEADTPLQRTAFDDTHRSAETRLTSTVPDVTSKSSDWNASSSKVVARKLLRPSGIVTAIQKIVLVKHIVHTRQAGYNIVEIPRAIKMNQSSRNAKHKPDNQYKRSDANAQAYLRFMRKLHHSSPSLTLGSAVVAVATSVSTAAETS